MQQANTQQMNVNEILKRMTKNTFSSLKLKKAELVDVLEHYKKLQVIYVDQDENIIFLWLIMYAIKFISYYTFNIIYICSYYHYYNNY